MKNMKTVRDLLRLMTAASVLFASGCLLAVPVAIQYYQSTRDYVATAEVDAPADRVYRTAIKEAQARSSTIKIVKRDDAGRLLEITNGVQTASVKAVPVSEQRTQIVVVANVPEDASAKDKEPELALRIIGILSDSLGVKYQITKR